MDAKTKFKKGWELMMEACQEQNWGDPFSYARSREILMSIELGHEVAKSLSGEDAIDQEGVCEYKSTISSSLNGTYNGISVMDSWEDQLSYLENDKIKKYKNHYFARFTDNPTKPIAEVWRMKGDKVYDLLVPKLQNKFTSTKKAKDPRLGANISKKEIQAFAERIY